MSNLMHHVCMAALVAASFTSSAAYGSSVVVKYTYDASGRVTTALYDNGTCIVYSYDAVGNRTTQVMQSGSSLTPQWGSGTLGCFKWTPT